jgi:hypothetical protein
VVEEKICFVISPIGESETAARKRSDQILRHIISPAAKECGYKTLRADQISKPGIITSQVIQHIIDDPLIVADLTDRNPNVFYELAIRHAIGKPLVQIIKKGELVPFDIAATRTIQFDYQDLDSVAETKVEIVKQIKAVENDASQVDTPISAAFNLQLLKHSGDPNQKSLAAVLSAIADLRSDIQSIMKRLNKPINNLKEPSGIYMYGDNREEIGKCSLYISPYRMTLAEHGALDGLSTGAREKSNHIIKSKPKKFKKDR